MTGVEWINYHYRIDRLGKGSMQMDWNELLTKVRLGREADKPSDDIRSEYMRDWDRIVYSSAFRRMQDKTQVFPLAESDYVRTRLTHSIEVSSVGRSLGTLVGGFVTQNEQIDVNPQDFGNIVATACLAHDIGNPPFGHSGEEAIRNWFAGKGEMYLCNLTAEEREDFLNFEGNAQGFRILTRLQNAVGRGGMQLTYAVLAAYMKYPRASYPGGQNKSLVSEKKFGYYLNDRENFLKIVKRVGLVEKRDGVYARHPLAFLMEAADDICYRVIDLEDGYRVGRVSFNETESLLMPIAFRDSENPLKSSYSEIEDERGKIEYLRARAINNMVVSVVDVFKSNYEQIMVGAFEKDLTSLCVFSDQMDLIKKQSRAKVYAAPNVLHIEAAGFEVLGGLLDKVVPALVLDEKKATSADKKILSIIPRQFTHCVTRYERMLAATDFVSGMTDTYAVTLFRRLRGIDLPTG
jgi:dGTPase